MLYLSYQPISTFELRPSNTTKTGGKTLLVPTPYTLKMAFLDRLIRYYGLETGIEQFPVLRDMTVYIHPPQAQAVNRTFQKILRPDAGAKWKETIAMREFCVQAGTLDFVLDFKEADTRPYAEVAAAINYFGQRGSFYQLVAYDAHAQTVPADYVNLSEASALNTLKLGFLQRMDDMVSDARFEDVSAFNPKSKGGRRSYNVILPYRIVHNGFNHTVWEHSS